MYDFYKKNKLADNSATDHIFTHPFFLRGKKHLLNTIKRKTNLKHDKNKELR